MAPFACYAARHGCEILRSARLCMSVCPVCLSVCLSVYPLACLNKAVEDRRLRPRCCHMGRYFKRPKSSPVLPLACNWYYCAQFIAKPKAVCALRFSWAATSSNPGLRENNDVIHKPKYYHYNARGGPSKNFVKIGRVVPKI